MAASKSSLPYILECVLIWPCFSLVHTLHSVPVFGARLLVKPGPVVAKLVLLLVPNVWMKLFLGEGCAKLLLGLVGLVCESMPGLTQTSPS
jgi:hypothetical protein